MYKKKDFIMLTEHDNPIDYELDISLLISSVVPDFFLFVNKKFTFTNIFLNFLCFVIFFIIFLYI